MADPSDDQVDAPELPSAVVDEREGFSLVWLIPIVAALIGLWVAWTAYSERGPTIVIRFESAEGLEAGTTLVTYKNVQVGKVEEIRLTEDLSQVEVTVEMVSDAKRYLTTGTRFWVARARVSATQVTDVETLLSGAYIGMDPSTEGSSARYFEGLETPPIVTSEDEGLHLTLRADSLGSLDLGAPVYYRRIDVGRLVAYELDADGEGVTARIFIEGKHEARVHSNTHFWNVSGIDASFGPGGLEIDTASVTSMLIGGIAFDTPVGDERGDPVDDGAVFTLYPNRTDSEEARYRIEERYLMHFEQSVAGLTPGSPVTFRGILIGEVEDVHLVFHPDEQTVEIPVVVVVQPERIGIAGGEGDETVSVKSRVALLVERGMRAQLTTASFLTGQLAIALDFHPDAEPAVVDYSGRYPEVPTVVSPLEEIAGGVERIVSRLEKVPIEDIAEGLRGTLGELNQMVATLNDDAMPALAGSLDEAEKAMSSVSSLLASDSATGQELRLMLIDLSQAVGALRRLAEHLEAQPEDLLRGRDE